MIFTWRRPRDEGYLDSVTTRSVVGWARAAKSSGLGVEVEIRVDGHTLGVCVARNFRQDLLDAGVGDGGYGFEFALDPPLSGGGTYHVDAVLQKTGMSLGNSPRVLTFLPDGNLLENADFEQTSDEGLCHWDSPQDVSVVRKPGPGPIVGIPTNHYLSLSATEGARLTEAYTDERVLLRQHLNLSPEGVMDRGEFRIMARSLTPDAVLFARFRGVGEDSGVVKREFTLRHAWHEHVWDTGSDVAGRSAASTRGLDIVLEIGVCGHAAQVDLASIAWGRKGSVRSRADTVCDPYLADTFVPHNLREMAPLFFASNFLRNPLFEVTAGPWISGACRPDHWRLRAKGLDVGDVGFFNASYSVGRDNEEMARLGIAFERRAIDRAWDLSTPVHVNRGSNPDSWFAVALLGRLHGSITAQLLVSVEEEDKRKFIPLSQAVQLEHQPHFLQGICPLSTQETARRDAEFVIRLWGEGQVVCGPCWLGSNAWVSDDEEGAVETVGQFRLNWLYHLYLVARESRLKPEENPPPVYTVIRVDAAAVVTQEKDGDAPGWVKPVCASVSAAARLSQGVQVLLVHPEPLEIESRLLQLNNALGDLLPVRHRHRVGVHVVASDEEASRTLASGWQELAEEALLVALEPGDRLRSDFFAWIIRERERSDHATVAWALGWDLYSMTEGRTPGSGCCPTWDAQGMARCVCFRKDALLKDGAWISASPLTQAGRVRCLEKLMARGETIAKPEQVLLHATAEPSSEGGAGHLRSQQNLFWLRDLDSSRPIDGCKPLAFPEKG